MNGSNEVNTRLTSSSNPSGSRYLRPEGNGDTYDEFKGVGLPGLVAGSFSEQPLDFGFKFVGADPNAGPNSTGQPAVNSHYKPAPTV